MEALWSVCFSLVDCAHSYLLGEHCHLLIQGEGEGGGGSQVFPSIGGGANGPWVLM